MLSPTQTQQKLKVSLITRYDDHIPNFYCTHQCSNKNVRDALAPEITYWSVRDPTLIAAPPGAGKTTLACEELLPRAINTGKNILFILNRVALATQLKYKIIKAIDPVILERLTDRGIRETECFGNVGIITYHRLPAFVNNPSNQDWIKNLMYTVADEIHFICADSSFNEKCGYYLKLLTLKFQHAIRVYLTGTEWDVLIPLAEAEMRNYRDTMRIVCPWLLPRNFNRYVFPTDYSHVHLHFFDDLDEIVERIKSNPDEKWMLFMSNKREGKDLAKQLGKQAIYLDSESKDTKEWYQLLKESHFQQQVLVTTSVLDCGVNVIDQKLRNVVIFSDDRTQLIQMLGRKRCNKGEHVNLFVNDIDEKTIAKRYNDGKCLCQWLERYEEETREGRSKMAHEIWHTQDEDLKLYFDLANGYLVPNHVAFFSLKRKMNFYRSLMNGEVTFQQAVRNWLGLSEENVPMVKNTNLEERLLSFCVEHLNQTLTDDEISTFREMVITIADQIGVIKTRSDRIESIGREALNKRLETFMCPYRLARSTWKIIENQEE